jgi:hypothetical protein
MARQDPAVRAKKRQQVSDAMNKSPVSRLINAGMTAIENIRGLNIGGAQSGRMAKAQAQRNAQKTLVGKMNTSGAVPTMKGVVQAGDSLSQSDVEDMISGKKRK